MTATVQDTPAVLRSMDLVFDEVDLGDSLTGRMPDSLDDSDVDLDADEFFYNTKATNPQWWAERAEREARKAAAKVKVFSRVHDRTCSTCKQTYTYYPTDTPSRMATPGTPSRVLCGPCHERRYTPVEVVKSSGYYGDGRYGYVYHLFDASGDLLYVGKTYRVQSRFFTGVSSHATTKPWWSQVLTAQVSVYANEEQALAAEALFIREDRPRHNMVRPSLRSLDAPTPILTYTASL